MVAKIINVPHWLYNIWVTSTVLWSSQLHASCVCNTLQTSKGCFLFGSKLKCSWEASPIFLQNTYSYLVTLLVFNFTTIMQPRHSSRGRCVRSKKHQPHQECYKPSERDTNLTKGRSFSTTLWFRMRLVAWKFVMCHMYTTGMQLRWPKYG